MARKNKTPHHSLTFQSEQKLKSKLAIGDSKDLDKALESKRLCEKRKIFPDANLSYDERITIHKIYSWCTFKKYQEHCCYFLKWCKNNYSCKTLEECRPYANEWLEARSNLSAYTQKLEVCALAKLYDCTSKEFIPTSSRHRKDITRSRKPAKRDKNFSETKHKDFIDFCRGTGLRKSELKCLHGDQLLFKNSQYYIAVTRGAKVGRYREAPIISNIDAIVERFKNAGTEKVWSHIPDLDIHSYRSYYCCTLYQMHARPLEEIPKKWYYVKKKYKLNREKFIIFQHASMYNFTSVFSYSASYLFGDKYPQ